MRIMTDAVDVRVQAISPAPVFRASADVAASAFRLVSGQECFGTAAAWQVESVSGTGLAGAAGALRLVALGGGLLERHGYIGLAGQERPRPVVQPVPAPLTALVLGLGLGLGPVPSLPQASGNGDGISERDDDSSKGDNGGEPMTPWDFRTCGPPG